MHNPQQLIVHSSAVSMKSCHRFIRHTTAIAQEPYHRFDFEKSLRKYEKMPAKKQKRDVGQSRHRELASEAERNIAIEGKAEEKVVLGNNKCQRLPASPETVEEVRQTQQGSHSQTVKQSNVQPEPSQQDTTSIHLTASQPTLQPQQLPKQLPTATALSPCQQKEQSQLRSSGRFHLSSSVFISARSLERLVKLGSEQLVLQQLFKQRQYLAEDSGEVARRVRQYMEQ